MTLNVGVPSRDRLIGRAAELVSLEQSLEALGDGGSGAVVLVGEPGIGKTRLLGELAARAERCGYLVLSGSASELERDLPFSVFVDALDEYVEGLHPSQLSRLDDDVQAELAHIFPSLLGLGNDRQVALQHERYRSHRAVRALLERLAEEEPLVLVLDDLQWRTERPLSCSGHCCVGHRVQTCSWQAVALRPRHPVGASRGGARASASCRRLPSRLELGSPQRRPSLESSSARRWATRMRACSTTERRVATRSTSNSWRDRSIAQAGAESRRRPPVSVNRYPTCRRRLADRRDRPPFEGRTAGARGAAVAGDPFEPELASAAAGTSEPAALDALYWLLRLDLIRSTEVPRRFRFRHPLVRRAVYEATAAAWRLGAHERCADALAARGATAVARAHHVERYARDGDLGAVALLAEAGEATARLAPANAAHWFSQRRRACSRRWRRRGAGRAPARPRRRADNGRRLFHREPPGTPAEALAISPDATHATRARLRAGMRRCRTAPRPARAGPRTSCDRSRKRARRWLSRSGRL